MEPLTTRRGEIIIKGDTIRHLKRDEKENYLLSISKKLDLFGSLIQRWPLAYAGIDDYAGIKEQFVTVKWKQPR